MSWEEFALGATKLLRVCVFRCHASVRFPPRVDFILGIPPFSVKHDCFVVVFFLILPWKYPRFKKEKKQKRSRESSPCL